MPDIGELLAAVLQAMRVESKHAPSRELSLAITNVEQACLWWEQVWSDQTDTEAGPLNDYRGES